MSEDDDEVSGAKPAAGRRALRPTVLPASSAPTRGGSRERIPDAKAAGAPAPAPPAVRTPTAIPGVERRRIAVTIRDLKALSPGAAMAVYERALKLVSTFVVEKSAERTAILWGHERQKAYGDLVTATLALSQAPLLRRVDGYLTRMMDILGSIDLMAVCGYGNGGLARLFSGVNDKVDTPEELRTAQAELDQLVGYLGVALHDLLDLKDKLEHHSREVADIGVELEASALAALFLARRFQQEKGGLAQRFTERSMSLTQTVAQIRSGDPMRAIQIEQPVRLVRAVQEVALVMLPGLLASLASALTLLGRNRLTLTQAGELTHQLRTILRALQP